MHKARKNSKSISLTGDATGGTPAERGRDVGVVAGPVRSFQNVLRRFHNTPLGLYSYFISNGRMDLLRRSKVLRTSAVMAMFALVLLTSAILVPLYNKLEVTEAATGTAKESSLSFNLTNSTASVDLSVNKANGAFGSSTSPIAFNISTTNVSGYTLSIKNSKSTTTLVNSTNSSYTLSSLTGTVTPTNFSADSTTAATNYNGKWGYYPNKYNSSTNSYYRPSPTTAASTLDKTSSANTSGTVNSYTIGIGARASYTTPAGEYTGTYILTAVGNTVSYSITFNKGNTSDTVSNLPSTQSSSGTSSTSITLSSTKPTRTGYTFTGWCMGTISTNTSTHVDSCTGTNSKTFSAGSSFGIDQTTSNITTLYAMWTRNNVTYTLNYNANNGTEVPNSQSNTNNNGSYTFTLNTTTIPTRSGYNFLGYATTSSATTPTYTYTAGTGTNGANGTFSPSTIILSQSSMSSTAESTTLYAVWGNITISNFTYMQDVTTESCNNTAIGTTATVKDNRDNTEYTIGKLADGNCWLLDNLALDLTTVSLSKLQGNTNASNAELSYLKNGGGTTSNQYATSGVIKWPSSSYSFSVPWIKTNYINTTGSGGYSNGKYGIYYNYCAASAGSYCYGNGTSAGAPNGNATSDICPSGWRMPTGSYNDDYETLYNAYGNYNAFIEATRIPLAGYMQQDNQIYGQNTIAYIWSATAHAQDRNAWGLGVNTDGASTINPHGGGSRIIGMSVRCIMKTYMQDLSSTTIAALLPNVGDSATVYDKRDGQDYSVAKLADGKYWMTKNLNLAGGTKLYSSDSDVPAGYDSTPYFTLPASSTTGFSNNTTAYVYNSNRDTCSDGNPCYSYYSWLAATVGGKDSNGNAVTAEGYNAPYSVCPKGWRLPTSTTSNANATLNNNWKTGDWYALATAYGANLTSNYYDSASTFYDNVNGGNAAGKFPTYLVLSGNYRNNAFAGVNSYAYYWSATSYSSSAYVMHFFSSTVMVASYTERMYGNAIRCLFAG